MLNRNYILYRSRLWFSIAFECSLSFRTLALTQCVLSGMSVCLFFFFLHCTIWHCIRCVADTFFWSFDLWCQLLPFCSSLFIVHFLHVCLCVCERVFLLLYHLRILRSYSFDVVVYNFSVCYFMLLLSFVVVVIDVVFLAFYFRSVLAAFIFFTSLRFQFALTQYWQKITLCALFFLPWILHHVD